MKILLVHNYYRHLGGEDVSVDAEARMLEQHGHQVLRYSRFSIDVETTPGWRVAADAVWSRRTYREVRAILRKEKPDVLHCTNTFPLISPSVYRAAADEKTPVVQALRNYRRMCANACFYAPTGSCEICLTKTLAIPSISRSCYRASHTASTIFVVQQATMRWMESAVNRYYTLTEFSRQKFISAGFPADRIDIKPNFIDPDPGPGPRTGDYALFAGRLSAEKGVEILLAAWRLVGHHAKLKIVGDGPDRSLVEAAVAEGLNIEYLGLRSPTDVLDLAGDALCVVMSSTVYETFGRTIVEAYSRGVPVVAPRLGALGEIVRDGVTGFCYEPRDATALAERVLTLVDDPVRRQAMGDAGRRLYEQHYTAAVNHINLMDIYRRALGTRFPVGPSKPLADPTAA